MGVNQKRDQDALCNEMRKDSKEEREAESGLLGLKASGVLDSIVDDFVEKRNKKFTKKEV